MKRTERFIRRIIFFNHKLTKYPLSKMMFNFRFRNVKGQTWQKIFWNCNSTTTNIVQCSIYTIVYGHQYPSRLVHEKINDIKILEVNRHVLWRVFNHLHVILHTRICLFLLICRTSISAQTNKNEPAHVDNEINKLIFVKLL